ncbi:sugar nucleotide-binding protein [Clostridiaceae bacterium M8S5]|nr:sugar nucleotide-binding protein [Clostridiaceae bacterium M8S5]
MHNILILGSTGMAGHVITMFLQNKEDFNVYNLSHRYKLNPQSKILDVMDINKIDNYLNTLQLDFIVNSIGVLNNNAKLNIDKAIYLNSYFPNYLSNKYKNTNTKIIQLSTDCVFSGLKGRYKEDDFRDGNTIYSRTKALGELKNNKDITLRMSIVGPDVNEDGIGLFNWFMSKHGQIKGYDKALWNGLTTLELAKIIEVCIRNDLRGLYNIVSKEIISKYKLLMMFKKVFKRYDIIVKQDSEYVVDKSLVNTRNDLEYEAPEYEKMIKDMKEWIIKHSNLYPHYFRVEV